MGAKISRGMDIQLKTPHSGEFYFDYLGLPFCFAAGAPPLPWGLE